MKTGTVNCVWQVGTILGEGPLWSAREQAVWFVDIKSSRLHRYRPSDGQTLTLEAPTNPGFILPRASGGYSVGCRNGLYDFDPQSGAFRLHLEVEADQPDNRLNDGHVDALGRLWFGTMHDPETEAKGVLYRYDSRGLMVQDSGYVVTNGPAIAPDGKTLYHNDTLSRKVYAFDLDADGTLSNKRRFLTLTEAEGYADGPVVDSEGNVWIGLFFGWGVLVVSPKGERIAHIRFPASNVTKIAFGGPDLKTVYATTAIMGLDDAGKAAQPLAGGLFSFTAPVAGQPQHAIAHI